MYNSIDIANFLLSIDKEKNLFSPISRNITPLVSVCDGSTRLVVMVHLCDILHIIRYQSVLFPDIMVNGWCGCVPHEVNKFFKALVEGRYYKPVQPIDTDTEKFLTDIYIKLAEMPLSILETYSRRDPAWDENKIGTGIRVRRYLDESDSFKESVPAEIVSTYSRVFSDLYALVFGAPADGMEYDDFLYPFTDAIKQELEDNDDGVDTVLNFIRMFHQTGGTSVRYDDEITKVFTHGCCYWFAYILKGRFPRARIFYDPIAGHFVTRIGWRFYDITGDVTGRYSGFDWDTYDDETHRERIERNCVTFEAEPGGEPNVQ